MTGDWTTDLYYGLSTCLTLLVIAACVWLYERPRGNKRTGSRLPMRFWDDLRG